MFVYLLMINVAAFGAMFMDKRFAQMGEWRIPERVLFYIVLAGGGIGGIAGMYVFHHKTKKSMFQIGFPAITILEYGLFFALWLMRLGR